MSIRKNKPKMNKRKLENKTRSYFWSDKTRPASALRQTGIHNEASKTLFNNIILQ